MKTNDHETGKRSPRSRLIRDTVNLSPIRLTPRDFELLTALSEYRLLTTTQIRKLFFRSHHRARKRLFKLWQHKLVDRLFRPVSLGDRPSDVIYKLAANGARLLGQQKGFAEQAIPGARRVKKLSPLFLDHTLAVNDFRIALKRACSRNMDARLVSWREGPAIRFEQTVIDRSREVRLVRIPVVADGLACIEVGNQRHYLFIEIDRGTIALGRWHRRFAAYAKASREEALRIRLGIRRFTVLIVAIGNERRWNLLNIAKSYSLLAGDHDLFRFSLMERVFAEQTNLLVDRVWFSPGGDELTGVISTESGKPIVDSTATALGE